MTRHLSQGAAALALMLIPCQPVLAQAAVKWPSSAEICGDCHRAAHESWKASGHAHAMDSRLFQDVLHYTEVDQGATARATCLGCHSPLAAITGDPDLKTKVSWEGVTCDACHSIREVSLSGPNPQIKRELTGLRTGPWKDDNPSQHGAIFSTLHTSSQLCASCHEYRNALGFPIVTTFSEWQGSCDAKDGHQCQFCHMPSVERVPLVARVVKTPTDTERHSHCESCHTAPGANVQGSPADPGLRVHGQLNLHEIQGSDSTELLTNAIDAQLAAVRDGNQVRVNVNVANKAAAHYIPTGSPLRQVILEVRADTDGGQHLVQQRVYQRTVAGRDGTPLDREYLVFERAAKLIADTRLAPAEKRAEVFLFDVPAGAETRVSVSLRYCYSPLAKAESQRSTTFLALNAVVR